MRAGPDAAESCSIGNSVRGLPQRVNIQTETTFPIMFRRSFAGRVPGSPFPHSFQLICSESWEDDWPDVPWADAPTRVRGLRPSSCLRSDDEGDVARLVDVLQDRRLASVPHRKGTRRANASLEPLTFGLRSERLPHQLSKDIGRRREFRWLGWGALGKSLPGSATLSHSPSQSL